ncbi:MAG: hypothetical protein ACKVP4_00690 [Hyphomicrobium sp.]
MTSNPIRPWLWLAAAASIALMTALAFANERLAITLTALLFAAALIAAAIAANAALRRIAGQGTDAYAAALGETAKFAALAWGWAGLAMLALYIVTPLHWRHGWQYGLVFSLIAIANAVYAHRLTTAAPGSEITSRKSVDFAVKLAALQGLAAAGALIWMAAADKFATEKGDWAANAIFLSGGLAIVALSALVVQTHAALTSAPNSDANR